MKDFSKYNFAGQGHDEIIQMVIRRHKVAMAAKVGMFILGCIAPLVVYALLVTYTAILDDATSFSYLLVVLLGSVFYLYMVLFLYHAWVDYYLDVWTITDKRIIATEQQGLFHRTTSELRMDRIQDVSSLVKGVFPTLFRYGTIHVQTASEQDKFVFKEVPDSEEVSRKILEIHNQYHPPAREQTPGDHQHATHQ